LAEDSGQIETRNEEFYRLFHQALVDVAPLRAPRAGKEASGPPDGTRHVDGWAIRTLCADHRAFNPYNFQTRSV
jgi:hypothetical protein